MNQATETTATHDEAHTHAHHPNLAHHFESMGQQNDAGKLAMWVFLATEILMFGGLFCWYAIWRARHFDIFDTGHTYLDTKWGAINTVILIASSFTMAWGVRCAQLNKRTACWALCLLTVLGGAGFMGIKYIEYSAKFGHGMGPGRFYTLPIEAQKLYLGDAALAGATTHAAAGATLTADAMAPHKRREAYHGPKLYDESGHGHEKELAQYLNHHGHTPAQLSSARSFFSIYFALTGLHGLHVLVGMGLVGWITIRAYNGQFSSEYNAPVDIVGLYWHLVDLIWIFLFPLLYLI